MKLSSEALGTLLVIRQVAQLRINTEVFDEGSNVAYGFWQREGKTEYEPIYEMTNDGTRLTTYLVNRKAVRELRDADLITINLLGDDGWKNPRTDIRVTDDGWKYTHNQTERGSDAPKDKRESTNQA